jgi:hypothetical protein
MTANKTANTFINLQIKLKPRHQFQMYVIIPANICLIAVKLDALNKISQPAQTHHFGSHRSVALIS